MSKSPNPEMPPLLTTLEGRLAIARHDHVAVLYRGADKTHRFASFLAEGLKQGELCVYLGPQEGRQGLLAKLEGLGLDSGTLMASHRFSFEAGAAESKDLQNLLPHAIARAEHAGAGALRWLEEGIWAESSGLAWPPYFEFHSLLNYQVKHFTCAALCQYALDRMEAQQICSAIAVHRHLIIEDTFVRDNPFYVPPERYLPATIRERERDLAANFREIGFDVPKLLESLVGYGQLGLPWKRD